MTDPLLSEYRTYPRMAHWFDPLLLLKLLNNVILSSLFGQYADRRLIMAALDTVGADVHFDRACAIGKPFKPDSDGAVWLDWVADLGDGFRQHLCDCLSARTAESYNWRSEPTARARVRYGR